MEHSSCFEVKNRPENLKIVEISYGEVNGFHLSFRDRRQNQATDQDTWLDFKEINDISNKFDAGFVSLFGIIPHHFHS